MSHKRKLKKFYEKERTILENKKKFKPKHTSEHTLENCPCGVPKHNPKYVRKKNKKLKQTLDNANRQNNNSIKKRNQKNINYVYGGEYKDRHGEW